MAETTETPTQLPGRSWWAAVKRTLREFRVDNLSDWAAALTYYGVLSIFPALLVLVSLIDLAGRGTIDALLANLGQVAPGSVNQILKDAIGNLQQTRGSAGVLALVGLAVALWSASGYIAAFMRASNARQGFRWVTPGGILAVVVWVLASVAFALYVANFGSYNKTYGSLASVIIFLVWLWLSNTAILLGAELNAELERGRAIAAGHPPEEEPYLELRDTSRIRAGDG